MDTKTLHEAISGKEFEPAYKTNSSSTNHIANTW